MRYSSILLRHTTLALPSAPPRTPSLSQIQSYFLLRRKLHFQTQQRPSSPLPHPRASGAGVPRRKLHFQTQQRPSSPLPHPRASGAGVPDEEAGREALVQELRVPSAWLSPSIASQESKWLKVALHKWLDDEYCPEATNVEISKVAAHSYYESLMEQQSDLGEILLKMIRDLDSVSFQDSFHGVFSAANAAIHLITLRMNSTTTG